MLKPILKWQGSKFNQSKITAIVNDFYKPFRETHDLVEPFTGGAGMTHALEPRKAILGDSNYHLIRFYRSLQTGFDWNKDYKAMLTTQGYESLNILINQYMRGDVFLKAADFMTLFYLLNKSSFNGLWRVNGKGKYNVPAGKDSKGRLYSPELPDIAPYTKQFENYLFQCDDYEDFLIANYHPDIFLYCDPPYDTEKANFTGYTADGFTWKDQVQLILAVKDLECPIVISNKATDRIIKLYEFSGFDLTIISAKRSRTKNVDEVIASKNCKK